MDDSKRLKNEKEFTSWIENKEGGRVYSFEVKEKLGWKAKYLKEVNEQEITIRFWQEVYDENNILREMHEKYPIDKGHQTLNDY